MNPFHWLPKFIWGEAITSRAGSEFEDCEYLTHTSFPRFVCRIVPLENFAGDEGNDGSIRVWREGSEGDPVWKTNFGFLARDFLWINWPDNDEVVAGVMREICVDRRIREELYETMD